jgi:phosphonopyruvate decarboxylase
MVNTKEFYDSLLANKVDFFTGVPDSLLANFCACVKENSPSQNNIIAANEGNAVAIAAGYHIASGNYGVVYMQNSGLGNTVNPILSLADEEVYRVPMLLIIGWRGEPGKHDEPQHVKQGKLTLPLLECMGIDYQVLNDDYKAQLETALNYIREESKPYALVVQKGTFSDYKITKEAPRHTIKREEALEAAMGVIEDDAFIVSTTGKTSREIFEIRERWNQGHSHDFLTVGSMGHTASIALGMSIGSDKNIYCIDGDGSFIMHMGGMGIAAANAGKNFKYILINNGAHESVGGQPTIGFDLDVEAILKASGFKNVYTAETKEDVEAGVKRLRDEALSALIIYTNQGSREDLGRPTIAPEQNKLNMMGEFRKA